jgi:hypothetical protein
MDAYLIIAKGGHTGMGVVRAEAMLRAMEQPCLFPEPSPAPHAIQGGAPSPLPQGAQSKLNSKLHGARKKESLRIPGSAAKINLGEKQG